MARTLRWELLGYFLGATAANSTHQSPHPWSLLCNPVMTGLMAFLMKATPAWPSSSSTLRFLNSTLQLPNCEIELSSPPCALPRTAAPRGRADKFDHRGPASVSPPSIDKRRWGLLSRAWTSAPSWSLLSALWKENTSRRREEGSCGPEA